MIQIEGLTKYYGDICAVDNVSFSIKKGEIMGLLGPNGAGKTTILKILACFMNPSSGNIKIKDFNIYNHSLEIKKIIGYLPESSPLPSDMLVYDYLNFVADIRDLESNRKGQRIKELADLCDLNEVMHKTIHQLSKGYKQRVGLAHAMMNDPEILVLDEPNSGLDPNQIIDIRNLIKEIGKEKTVILSTHILSEAEAVCNRVVIINSGNIMAIGPTEQLRKETGNEYMINVSLQYSDFNHIENAFKTIPEVMETQLVQNESGIIDFRLSCHTEKDIRPEIYKIIRDNDWGLLEFHKETRTLENIFAKLTGDN